jgi:hypothetical protein
MLSAALELRWLFFEACRRELDWWENENLTTGIRALFRGQYPFASCCALKALVPIQERAPEASRNSDEFFSLTDLRKAFDFASAAPLRRFPHFGPVFG